RRARPPAQASGSRVRRPAGPLPDARPGRGDRPEAGAPVLDLPARPVTLRPLPRSRLANLVPALVESQALIALVPATGDLRWGAQAAWDVARAAVVDDRLPALVALRTQDPR